MPTRPKTPKTARPPRKIPRKGTHNFTPEREDLLVHCISIGGTYKVAAAAAGISIDTLSEWLNRFPDFAERIDKAKGLKSYEALKRIDQLGASGSFRAATWLLERNHPTEYGTVSRRPPIAGEMPLDGSTAPDPDAPVFSVNINIPYIPGRAVRNDPDALADINSVLLERAAEKHAAAANQRNLNSAKQSRRDGGHMQRGQVASNPAPPVHK